MVPVTISFEMFPGGGQPAGACDPHHDHPSTGRGQGSEREKKRDFSCTWGWIMTKLSEGLSLLDLGDDLMFHQFQVLGD